MCDAELGVVVCPCGLIIGGLFGQIKCVRLCDFSVLHCKDITDRHRDRCVCVRLCKMAVRCIKCLFI